MANPKPLEAIQAAVTRVTRRGHRLGADTLRIAVEEALAAHALNGARVLGLEEELGSISEGKRADFVVLGADRLAVDPEAIAGIPVLQTWVDGARQYLNAAVPAAANAAHQGTRHDTRYAAQEGP